MYSDEKLARSIAGEIVLSNSPGKTIRKWRELFGVNQGRLADQLKLSPSVVSDYESGRRKSPGTQFTGKLVRALIKIDEESGGKIITTISDTQKTQAIIDQVEYDKPINNKKLIRCVQGRVLANKEEAYTKKIYGYTIIDSIQAILSLGEQEFRLLFGRNKSRALIFTKVHLGRSPMIAVKVTSPKPNMVILHGLESREVDKLAIKIAKIEKIPLVLSQIENEEELVKKLTGLTW
ncbi:MAG: helix-turn-helix domain-containing protein [Candidatus Altiarchaeota archaeon]